MKKFTSSFEIHKKLKDNEIHKTLQDKQFPVMQQASCTNTHMYT